MPGRPETPVGDRTTREPRPGQPVQRQCNIWKHDKDYLYDRGYMRRTEVEEKAATRASLAIICCLGSRSTLESYDLISIMDAWRCAQCLECQTWFLRTSGNSHNAKHACRQSDTPKIAMPNFPTLRRWHFPP
jgi:hypothetical protein